MANALSDLYAGLFNRRQADTAKPTADMLGSGMASNSANKLMLAREYKAHAIEAQSNGQDFPTFEEWLSMRGEQ